MISNHHSPGSADMFWPSRLTFMYRPNTATYPKLTFDQRETVIKFTYLSYFSWGMKVKQETNNKDR